MFRVLSQLPTLTAGIQPVAQRGYLVKSVHQNLVAVQKHYQAFTFTVPSDHILYKLLVSLPISFCESVQNYYDRIVDGTPEYANKVKLTTERYAGRLFQGEIYPGLTECIIGYGQSRYITKEFISNWRTWETVRVIDHPYTDLRYYPLHPKKASSGYGHATVLVDVPLLALQYRMWALAMGYVENGELRVKEPVMSFLASFPLVTALWSHNDVVFRNACLGSEATTRLISSPNMTTNQDNLFKQVALATTDTLLRKPRSFSDMLRQIPAFNENQFNAVKLPWLIDLRQTRWARDLGCLRLWTQLLRIGSASDSLDRNGQSVNDLLRALERTLNEGTWTSSPLPPDAKRVVMGKCAELIALIKD